MGFFIRRPIFAAVCSTVILLIGAISIPTLPVSQYPQIAPPTVSVSATYTGANAQTLEATVTNPLEEAINGVAGLDYMSSQSTNAGTVTITCVFRLGTNLDIAATDVQNAANGALGLLPAPVVATGLTIKKNSGSFVMAYGLYSTNPAVDNLQLSNFAQINIVDALKRVQGVSDVHVFGQRTYAMRIWVNPRKLAAYGLTANDVVNALSAQNVQVAAGAFGAPPVPTTVTHQLTIEAVGRLSDPAQFARIILKTTPNGGYVRVGDVGHVELGAQDYSTDLHFDGRTAVGLAILQLPDANALQVAQGVESEMARLSKTFPSGVHYGIGFNSTTFVHESIKEVLLTLLLAIFLVVLVIYLFLESWRTTLIPAITIPVSLVGTFFLMKILGFTINTLTLFGLTLATGLVVDDAIVVIENIARFIIDRGAEPRAGAEQALREIFGAVVASSLVLLAVFIPVGFFPGTTGELYKQFALTIACAITISLFTALTLTPALSALMIRRDTRKHNWFFRGVDRVIGATRSGYERSLPSAMGHSKIVGALFLAGLLLTGWMYVDTPTAFIPNEDVGYFIATLQTPDGSSLSATAAAAARAEKIILANPNVQHVFSIQGFSFSGSGPNFGIMFVDLQPWAKRPGYANSLDGVLASLKPKLAALPDEQVKVFDPPAIHGVGSVGGFQFELEDHGNVGLVGLSRAANAFVKAAKKNPALADVFTTFRDTDPKLTVAVDRGKAEQAGVNVGDVFSAMSIFLGSDFVNNFTLNGRSYRVYVEADTPFRLGPTALQQIYVRSSGGGLIPVSTLTTTSRGIDAPNITHYNIFRSIEVDGQAASGYSTGQALAAMEAVAKKALPAGIGYEWTGIALEQLSAGQASTLIFLLGIVFVFLVLSAKYESFSDPLVILFTVPLAILGALAGLWMRGIASDVYAQVGYVMLVGLATKNAILIVEFANQRMSHGLSASEAVEEACRIRLRPILMTSIAFILSITPLVFASGAGSASRHSLGTVVFGGMIVSTILNLYVIPVIYVFIVNLAG
ncbi:MAG: efflux RND transporter permease subunit, partial [Vulcanimicrobiaceae bacterium]